eukprot:m.342512 g.342512  ORF g.342512 m.342512 type:complete len:319 (-) comp55776_c0_seq25:1824-2780(-)
MNNAPMVYASSLRGLFRPLLDESPHQTDSGLRDIRRDLFQKDSVLPLPPTLTRLPPEPFHRNSQAEVGPRGGRKKAKVDHTMVQRSPGRKRTAKQVLGFAVSRMNSQQLCMVTAKLVSLRANVRIVALHLSRDADLSQSERCDAIPNAIKSIWLPFMSLIRTFSITMQLQIFQMPSDLLTQNLGLSHKGVFRLEQRLHAVVESDVRSVEGVIDHGVGCRGAQHIHRVSSSTIFPLQVIAAHNLPTLSDSACRQIGQMLFVFVWRVSNQVQQLGLICGREKLPDVHEASAAKGLADPSTGIDGGCVPLENGTAEFPTSS